jgi:6-phosphofructo-2-kinase / fructose-2,6-biphosphatase 4
LSQIWTSSRRRAHHTAWPFLAESKNLPGQHAIPNRLAANTSGVATPQASGGGQSLKVKVVEKTQMSEINPGVWDGLTPDQAKKYYPDEWDRFVKDPYVFRAPRAESYHDLSGTQSKPLLYDILIVFRQFD